MSEESFTAQNETQTKKIAQNLAKTLEKGTVLAFYGELGSGKTTFINYLASSLGVKKRLISPTFVIHKTYKNKNFNFHHVDLYRLKSETEVVESGITSLFEDHKNIIAIEWAEKMGNLLPKNAIKVYLRYIDENKRKIMIK